MPSVMLKPGLTIIKMNLINDGHNSSTNKYYVNVCYKSKTRYLCSIIKGEQYDHSFQSIEILFTDMTS
jgi:hypothetical protein